jgi:transposase
MEQPVGGIDLSCDDPGIGFLSASAITATVADASAFQSGRDFAAWIGLRAPSAAIDRRNRSPFG